MCYSNFFLNVLSFQVQVLINLSFLTMNDEMVSITRSDDYTRINANEPIYINSNIMATNISILKIIAISYKPGPRCTFCLHWQKHLLTRLSCPLCVLRHTGAHRIVRARKWTVYRVNKMYSADFPLFTRNIVSTVYLMNA